MTADVLPSPVQGGVWSGSFTVHNLVNGEINKSVRSPDQLLTDLGLAAQS